jgi:hypothetical protein
MTFVVEQDEPPDPIDVSFFGADGIVFEADDIADRIEELLLGRFGRGVGGWSIMDGEN